VKGDILEDTGIDIGWGDSPVKVRVALLYYPIATMATFSCWLPYLMENTMSSICQAAWKMWGQHTQPNRNSLPDLSL